jgi:hypothetical protein
VLSRVGHDFPGDVFQHVAGTVFADEVGGDEEAFTVIGRVDEADKQYKQALVTLAALSMSSYGCSVNPTAPVDALLAPSDYPGLAASDQTSRT